MACKHLPHEFIEGGALSLAKRGGIEVKVKVEVKAKGSIQEQMGLLLNGADTS